MKMFFLEQKILDSQTNKTGIIKEFLNGLLIMVWIDGQNEILRFNQLEENR